MWLVRTPRSPYLKVRFPDPDGSGRIVEISTREKTERKARARAAQIVDGHRIAWERTRKGGKITAHAVAREYWDAELSTRKWAPTARRWLTAIVEHLGETRTYCEVSISDVAAFVDVHAGTVSDSTINRALAIWRRMHTYAAEIREYPVKTIQWARLMRDEPGGRTRHLSPEDLARLISHLPQRGQEIVLFAVMTGARREQVLGLEWSRVDIEAKTAQIWLKSRRRYVPHTIDLNASALRIIERRLAVRTSETVFETTNFRRDWETALARAEIQNFRFHDLRHTFATMAARKASLAVVQKLLGHAAITTTSRYSHVQREDMRAAVQALPDLTVTDTGET